MAKFTVLRPEQYYSHVEIDAENREQAISKVKDGQGVEIFCEYSHTLDNGWSIDGE